MIPSVITKIDENGVWFRSSLSASTFVANEKVKAVELAPEPPNNTPPVRLTRSKRRPAADAAPNAKELIRRLI